MLLAACGATPEGSRPARTPSPLVPAPVAPPPPPPSDDDNDGLLGAADRCPAQPEDCDAFQDDDGCPDLDNDSDRVVDVCDACPLDAEIVNDFEDADGCPDAPVRVIIQSVKQERRIVIRSSLRIVTRIFFSRGNARVRSSARNILDEIATLLRQSTQVELVATLGRAAADEPNARRLSQRRAEAVRAGLVSRGVEATRLVAYGIGTSRPLGAVADAERSVELVVMRVDGFDFFRWTGTDVESTTPPEPPRPPAPPRPPCVPAPLPARGHPCD